MVGASSPDGQTVSGASRSRDYECCCKRVRMVSFWDLRTFEMVLTVSLIRLSSRLKPKENLVENLTILVVESQ